MTRFHDVLDPLRTRLTLAAPARDAILEELAADLDDLFRHHLSSGRNETEARALAVEACDLSDETLSELVKVHTSGIGRIQTGLTHRLNSPWERWTLTGTTVIALALLVLFLSSQPVLRDAGPGGWAVLALLAATLVLAVRASRRVTEPIGSANQRRALGRVLALGGWQIVAAVGGWWMQLFRASRAASDTPETLARLLTDWALSGAALMSLTLACVLVTGLAWHAAASRAGSRFNPTDRGESS